MNGEMGHKVSRRTLLGLLSMAGLLAVPGEGGATAFAFPSQNPTIPPINGGEKLKWMRRPVVPNKITDKIQPLEYSDQRLHPDSLLGRRIDLNMSRGLLGAIDLDSYLRPYLESTRPRWPAGEFLGKFMQAYARMYLYSGNPELLAKSQKISKTWTASQHPDGWVGTGTRWGGWDVWEHKYTVLGLLEQYKLTGDESSLNAAKKIGDLLASEFAPGRRDLMRTGGWAMGSGSVLEPMVYLYRFTAEDKYLQFCFETIRALESSTGPKLIAILGHGSGSVYDVVDPVGRKWHNGRKGYEMISCLIGLLRMYQLTGNSDYYLPAEKAHRDISQRRLYITGTTTNSETFRPAEFLPGESADDVGEGCVSAHWLYMNRILLQITGNPLYADEIEKTLYNHLLGSCCPTDAHQAYFTPLNGTRPFELQNIWSGQPPCCFSSVMRCISRTPESMWGTLSDGGFALLLYNRGTASAMIKTNQATTSVNFAVETDFPTSGNVLLRVNPREPREFLIALRVPSWTRSFGAEVNGKTWKGTPGRFLMINRQWRSGDELHISIDMNDHLVSGAPSYEGYYAFQHGPQVLALDSRLSQAALGEVKVNLDQTVSIALFPSVLPSGWIGCQAYTSDSLEASAKAILVPFSDTGQEGASHTYRTWIHARSRNS
jgi:uncharacterized protein